jgi:hypothetical protein
LTLVDTGLPLDWLARNRTAVRATGRAIAKLAEGYAVDIVQLNAPALAAEVDFPMPVVAVNHSCISTWWAAVKDVPIDAGHRWRADLTTKGLARADFVVTPSAAFSEATQSANGLASLPGTVHNGRTPLDLPQVAPHDFAFTAGRLWDKGKNLATLDRAAAELPVPLYMAGPQHGPSGDSIELEHARGLGSLGEKELARWLAAKPCLRFRSGLRAVRPRRTRSCRSGLPARPFGYPDLPGALGRRRHLRASDGSHGFREQDRRHRRR